MNRHLGIATIALLAHSGAALAQPVMVAPPDDAPRARVERPGVETRGPTDMRGPAEIRGTAERQSPERRSEAPTRAQRGPAEEMRAQDGPRGPQRGSDQPQRERPAQPDMRSPEPQRAQTPKQVTDQAQRGKAPDTNRAQSEPAKPEARPTLSAQPQRPEAQPSADTARPAAQPGQPSSDTAAQRTGQQPTNATAGASAVPNAAATNTAATSSGNEAEQRIAEMVRERIERNQIRPVSNFGVSVSVGAELPSRLQLQPLPSEIASIRPQYRDYRYTVSESEIVIVDPRSRRIVEVIDRNGGRGAFGGADVYTVLEQRRDVRRWDRPTGVVFQVGTVLPAAAPYYDVPVEIIERNPQWRGYQYVMTSSDEIAIVEPRSHRIVEVVDRSSSGLRSASTATTATSSQSFAAAPRNDLARMILSAARPGEINPVDSLKGAVLPQDVIMQPLPESVAERETQLKGLNYALLGDDVLIVEPSTRRVVDVIK